MLLRIFKANSGYNFFLLPIVGALLLLKSYLSPGVFPPVAYQPSTPLFSGFYHADISYITALVINFAAMLIICVQLLFINAEFAFVKERTFLPAYLFLFMVYAIPDLRVFQPVLLSAIFLLFAIKSVFSAFEKKSVIANAFIASFCTGLTGMFYPGLLILVLLVPFGLYSLKSKIGWREYLASLIGLLLPIIYLFTFYFVTDNVQKFIELFTNLINPQDKTTFHTIPVLAYFSYLVLITIFSSLYMLGQYDENKISTRQYFKILFFYFFTSALLFFFPAVSYELIIILAIPLSFLMTNYFNFMRRRFWAELFFTILIAFSVALQFIIE
ncbi:MAG TPA: DUF6427 family protein [Prolixibacteraceae bacterium]|nr:DUF6427 family protein [Prolixibacteraceae bacterium]